MSLATRLFKHSAMRSCNKPGQTEVRAKSYNGVRPVRTKYCVQQVPSKRAAPKERAGEQIKGSHAERSIGAGNGN